jgi:hypothetical protein
MRLSKILFLLTAISVCISKSGLAMTCSEYYENKNNKYILESAITGTVEAVSVIGLLAEGVRYNFDKTTIWTRPQNKRKVAELLQAASSFNDNNRYDTLEKFNLRQYNKLNSFYKKHILKPFPNTKIILDDVIESLAEFNKEGMRLGICGGLTSRSQLAKWFFKGGELTIDREIQELDHEIDQLRKAENFRNNRRKSQLLVPNQALTSPPLLNIVQSNSSERSESSESVSSASELWDSTAITSSMGSEM